MGVIDSTQGVTDCNHFGTVFFGEIRGWRTDLTKSLHHHAQPLYRQVFPLERLERRHHHPASSCLAAAQRATNHDGFPSYDRWHRVATMHRIRIHNPRHLALTGSQVWRWNVTLWTH